MSDQSDPQPEKPRVDATNRKEAPGDESFWDMTEPDIAIAGGANKETEPKPRDKNLDKEASKAVEQVLDYGPGEGNKNVKRAEATEASGHEKPKLRLFEVVAMAGFLLTVLGIGGWWLINSMAGIETTRLGDDDPEFPIDGEFVTVQSATSGWREPVRRGIHADTVRPEVSFIPVIEVELETGSRGILRVIFRNDLGEIAGDRADRAFRDGKFVRSGKPVAEFSATTGFRDEAELSGYRFMENRWTAEVYEGSSADASGGQLNLIFKMPIHPVRR